jgi:hypothetical protein
MLRGADEMAAHVGQALGVRDGGTTSDNAITWHSTIECLGACGGAPVMQVDHRFVENLTPGLIDVIIQQLRTDPAPYGARPEKTAPVASAPAEKLARPRGKRTQG